MRRVRHRMQARQRGECGTEERRDRRQRSQMSQMGEDEAER